jgi:hypothetical protein
VPVTVQVGQDIVVEKTYLSGASDSSPKCRMQLDLPEQPVDIVEVTLEQLAFGRSGDKGNNANIGIMARQPEYLPYIYQQLTAQVVEDYFGHLVGGEVERFEVPGMNAFNFFMTEALGGGGTASIRSDAQGKSMAQQLLSIKIRVPAGLVAG